MFVRLSIFYSFLVQSSVAMGKIGGIKILILSQIWPGSIYQSVRVLHVYLGRFYNIYVTCTLYNIYIYIWLIYLALNILLWAKNNCSRGPFNWITIFTGIFIRNTWIFLLKFKLFNYFSSYSWLIFSSRSLCIVKLNACTPLYHIFDN